MNIKQILNMRATAEGWKSRVPPSCQQCANAPAVTDQHSSPPPEVPTLLEKKIAQFYDDCQSLVNLNFQKHYVGESTEDARVGKIRDVHFSVEVVKHIVLYLADDQANTKSAHYDGGATSSTAGEGAASPNGDKKVLFISTAADVDRSQQTIEIGIEKASFSIDLHLPKDPEAVFLDLQLHVQNVVVQASKPGGPSHGGSMYHTLFAAIHSDSDSSLVAGAASEGAGNLIDLGVKMLHGSPVPSCAGGTSPTWGCISLDLQTRELGVVLLVKDGLVPLTNFVVHCVPTRPPPPATNSGLVGFRENDQNESGQVASMKTAFDRLDKDGNGTISAKKLKRLFKSLRILDAETKVQGWIMREWILGKARDGKGTVSFEELCLAYATERLRMNATFEAYCQKELDRYYAPEHYTHFEHPEPTVGSRGLMGGAALSIQIDVPAFYAVSFDSECRHGLAFTSGLSLDLKSGDDGENLQVLVKAVAVRPLEWINQDGVKSRVGLKTPARELVGGSQFLLLEPEPPCTWTQAQPHLSLGGGDSEARDPIEKRRVLVLALNEKRAIVELEDRWNNSQEGMQEVFDADVIVKYQYPGTPSSELGGDVVSETAPSSLLKTIESMFVSRTVLSIPPENTASCLLQTSDVAINISKKDWSVLSNLGNSLHRGIADLESLPAPPEPDYAKIRAKEAKKLLEDRVKTMRALFERFDDTGGGDDGEGDGELDVDETKRFLQEAFRESYLTKEELEMEIHDFMRMGDADGDGGISFDEFEFILTTAKDFKQTHSKFVNLMCAEYAIDTVGYFKETRGIQLPAPEELSSVVGRRQEDITSLRLLRSAGMELQMREDVKVSVGETVLDGDIVYYIINIDMHNVGKYKVKRRYNDFFNLSKDIQSDTQIESMIPPLPPKKLRLIRSDAFMEERKKQLVRFLELLLSVKESWLRKSTALSEFFDPGNNLVSVIDEDGSTVVQSEFPCPAVSEKNLKDKYDQEWDKYEAGLASRKPATPLEEVWKCLMLDVGFDPAKRMRKSDYYPLQRKMVRTFRNYRYARHVWEHVLHPFILVDSDESREDAVEDEVGTFDAAPDILKLAGWKLSPHSEAGGRAEVGELSAIMKDPKTIEKMVSRKRAMTRSRSATFGDEDCDQDGNVEDEPSTQVALLTDVGGFYLRFLDFSQSENEALLEFAVENISLGLVLRNKEGFAPDFFSPEGSVTGIDVQTSMSIQCDFYNSKVQRLEPFIEAWAFSASVHKGFEEEECLICVPAQMATEDGGQIHSTQNDGGDGGAIGEVRSADKFLNLNITCQVLSNFQKVSEIFEGLPLSNSHISDKGGIFYLKNLTGRPLAYECSSKFHVKEARSSLFDTPPQTSVHSRDHSVLSGDIHPCILRPMIKSTPGNSNNGISGGHSTGTFTPSHRRGRTLSANLDMQPQEEPITCALKMKDFRQAFEKADVDSSDCLNQDEIGILLKHLFQELSELDEARLDKEISHFLKVADENNSGEISWVEFKEAIEKSRNETNLVVRITIHGFEPFECRFDVDGTQAVALVPQRRSSSLSFQDPLESIFDNSLQQDYVMQTKAVIVECKPNDTYGSVLEVRSNLCVMNDLNKATELTFHPGDLSSNYANSLGDESYLAKLMSPNYKTLKPLEALPVPLDFINDSTFRIRQVGEVEWCDPMKIKLPFQCVVRDDSDTHTAAAASNVVTDQKVDLLEQRVDGQPMLLVEKRISYFNHDQPTSGNNECGDYEPVRAHSTIELSIDESNFLPFDGGNTAHQRVAVASPVGSPHSSRHPSNFSGSESEWRQRRSSAESGLSHHTRVLGRTGEDSSPLSMPLASVKDLELRLRPQVVVRNDLPHQVYYEIAQVADIDGVSSPPPPKLDLVKRAFESVSAVNSRVGKISSGRDVQILGLDMSATAFFRIQIMSNCLPKYLFESTEVRHGEPTMFTRHDRGGRDEGEVGRGVKLCKAIEIPIMSQEHMNFTQFVDMCPADEKSSGEKLTVKVVSEWKSGDSFPTLRLYTPVWVLNKTGLPLEYHVRFPRAVAPPLNLSDRGQNEVLGYANEAPHMAADDDPGVDVSATPASIALGPHISEQVPLMMMVDKKDARMAIRPDLTLYLDGNKTLYNWNKTLSESESVTDFLRIGVPENLHILVDITSARSVSTDAIRKSLLKVISAMYLPEGWKVPSTSSLMSSQDRATRTQSFRRDLTERDSQILSRHIKQNEVEPVMEYSDIEVMEMKKLKRGMQYHVKLRCTFFQRATQQRKDMNNSNNKCFIQGLSEMRKIVLDKSGTFAHAVEGQLFDVGGPGNDLNRKEVSVRIKEHESSDLGAEYELGYMRKYNDFSLDLVNLSNVGVSNEIQCPSGICIGVDVQALPGHFEGTTLVTMFSPYLFQNNSKFNIQVWPLFIPDNHVPFNHRQPELHVISSEARDMPIIPPGGVAAIDRFSGQPTKERGICLRIKQKVDSTFWVKAPPRCKHRDIDCEISEADIGAKVYSDETFRIQSLPNRLTGGKVIMGFNADRNEHDSTLINFEIPSDENVDVYVCYDASSGFNPACTLTTCGETTSDLDREARRVDNDGDGLLDSWNALTLKEGLDVVILNDPRRTRFAIAERRFFCETGKTRTISLKHGHGDKADPERRPGKDALACNYFVIVVPVTTLINTSTGAALRNVNCGWSRAISISGQNMETCVTWLSGNNGRPHLVGVNLSESPSTTASHVITVSDVTSTPPFRIENRSSRFYIWYGQGGASYDEKEFLAPGCSVSFAWPHQHLKEEIICGLATSMCSERQGPLSGLLSDRGNWMAYELTKIGNRKKLQGAGKGLEVQVYAGSGTTRVLAFNDFADKKSLEFSGQLTGRELAGSPEGSSLENVNFQFLLHGFGLTLLGEKFQYDYTGKKDFIPVELLNLCAETIKVESPTGKVGASISVLRFQIDDMQAGANFPVVLGCKDGDDRGKNEEGEKKFLELELFSVPGASDVTSMFEIFELNLASMVCCIDVMQFYQMYTCLDHSFKRVDNDRLEEGYNDLNIVAVQSLCETELDYTNTGSQGSLFFEEFLVQKKKSVVKKDGRVAHSLSLAGGETTEKLEGKSNFTMATMQSVVQDGLESFSSADDIDIRVIFIPPADRTVLTAALGPNLARLLGGVTGQIEMALAFDKVAWKQQFMTAPSLGWKVGAHFIKDLFYQIPVKILPFTAGITDISEELGRGELKKSLKRAGNMGSNFAFGVLSTTSAVFGNTLKTVSGFKEIEESSDDPFVNNRGGKNVFMKSIVQGFNGLSERPKEGLNQGPHMAVVGCAQGGLGFLVSPMIGGFDTLEKISVEMMEKTLDLKTRRPARNFLSTSALRTLRSSPLCNRLSVKSLCIVPVASDVQANDQASRSSASGFQNTGLVHTKTCPNRRTLDGRPGHPAPSGMGSSGRTRVGEKTPISSRVYAFAVVGPTEKLPLVTLGNIKDNDVRLHHHHLNEHEELLKQISRLDKKQQHDKNKELIRMKYDFERWSAFETIVDGEAVARFPSMLNGSLDAFVADGVEVDVKNPMEFNIVKTGYSLAIVFSGSKNMSRRKLIGYSLIDDTLIQEEVLLSFLLSFLLFVLSFLSCFFLQKHPPLLPVPPSLTPPPFFLFP
jgi:Ca2+-binding EF-hand superfamily protein